MVWVAGANGCRGGWFRVSREPRTGELRFDLLAKARDLFDVPPRPAVLALDIPIGLPEAGHRECDREARARLGRPRASSVFPAPIRPALRARTREEASRITMARDGRRVGAQAWALYAKIREVDQLLQSNAEERKRVFEVHPEVSFWAWQGRRPMCASKRTREGRCERARLARGWLDADVIADARAKYPRTLLADDDILDAIAVLWTAHRIANGLERKLPGSPIKDPTGLPMRIVYWKAPVVAGSAMTDLLSYAPSGP